MVDVCGVVDAVVGEVADGDVEPVAGAVGVDWAGVVAVVPAALYPLVAVVPVAL